MKREAAHVGTYSFLQGALLILFAPVILVAIFGGWSVFVWGLLAALLSSIVLVFYTREWEAQMKPRLKALIQEAVESTASMNAIEKEKEEEPVPSKITHIEEATFERKLADKQHQIARLSDELSEIKEEHRRSEQERAHFQSKCQELESDLNDLRLSEREHSEHKETLLMEYQKTIVEQRELLETKQQQITKLNNKVRDLDYEVKTLLQMDHVKRAPVVQPIHPAVNLFHGEKASLEPDVHVPTMVDGFERSVQTPFDASMYLRQCIHIAQNLTGAHHLGQGQSRFLNLSSNNYTIDLRRLFDNFRDESQCIILFFSVSEKKLLFVNNFVRNVLGWSAERFLKEFSEIVREGLMDWKHALSKLENEEESQTRLLVKNRAGENVLMHVILGTIPDGVFAGQVIGVMYPA